MASWSDFSFKLPAFAINRLSLRRFRDRSFAFLATGSAVTSPPLREGLESAGAPTAILEDTGYLCLLISSSQLPKLSLESQTLDSRHGSKRGFTSQVSYLDIRAEV